MVAQLSRDKELTEFFGRYFQYNRVRTRMLRSFLLNCCLLVVVGTIVYAVRREVPLALYGAWTGTWLVLGASAFWAYRKVRHSWYGMLKECYGTTSRSAGREAGGVVPSTGPLLGTRHPREAGARGGSGSGGRGRRGRCGASRTDFPIVLPPLPLPRAAG